MSDIPVKDKLFHLRPVFRSRYRTHNGLIEIAPWINVTLLMLVFFMASSATLKKPGIMIDLPRGPANAGARYDANVVSVPVEGMYFFDDERMSLNELETRLRQSSRQRPGMDLIIEADGRLSHQHMIELYQLAVDSGWQKVILATRPDFAPVR